MKNKLWYVLDKDDNEIVTSFASLAEAKQRAEALAREGIEAEVAELVAAFEPSSQEVGIE